MSRAFTPVAPERHRNPRWLERAIERARHHADAAPADTGTDAAP